METVNRIEMGESYILPISYASVLLVEKCWHDQGVVSVYDWRHDQPENVDTEPFWNTNGPFALLFNHDDNYSKVPGKTITEVKALLMTMGPELVDGGKPIYISVNEEMEATISDDDDKEEPYVCLYNPNRLESVLDITNGGSSVSDYHCFPETLLEEAKQRLIKAGVKFA